MSSALKIQKIPSTFFDERAPGSPIDTIVIHSMYAPDCDDEFSAESCKRALDSFEVSAHFVIDRAGDIFQLVDEEARAWHAGLSCMPFDDDDREGVNHFSLGIELIATEESGFADAQYEALVELSAYLISQYSIKKIVGHSDIAPDRKSDPWNFDWPRYRMDVISRVRVDQQLQFAH